MIVVTHLNRSVHHLQESSNRLLFVSFHIIGCVVSFSFVSGFQVECLRYVEGTSNSGGFYDSIVCGRSFSEGV